MERAVRRVPDGEPGTPIVPPARSAHYGSEPALNDHDYERRTIGIQRRFIDTPRARVHIAEAGAGAAVLLLHQTPRSWDEYRDVLPLIGAEWRAIAMDTVGFGDSRAFNTLPPRIETWAEIAFDMLDALGIDEVAVVGHHTGAATAIEMATTRPGQVRRLVLSSPPFVDAARRARPHGRAPVDEVERRADGGHLAELWALRHPLYPPGATDLLERFVIDALKAGPLAAEGHHAVGRYVMEARLPRIACPTLVIAAGDDPHARPRDVAASIARARLIEIAGGMVPLPDQMPDVFAATVLAFLREG